VREYEVSWVCIDCVKTGLSVNQSPCHRESETHAIQSFNLNLNLANLSIPPPTLLPSYSLHYTTLHHPSLPSHSNKVTKNTIKNFLLHAYMPKSKQANAGEKMQIITSSAATLVPRKRR
jgi:hypothetical protein